MLSYIVEGSNTLILSEEGSSLKTKLKFSINEDGELVLHQDGDDLNVLVPYSLSYDRPDKSPVIGKWISETEKEDGTVQKDLFWFLGDGQCILFVDVSGEIGDDVDEFTINGNHNGLESILYATHSGNKINLSCCNRKVSYFG